MNTQHRGKAFVGARSKDNELIAFYQYLLTHEATATQAAAALHIYRPNVCRYKRRLEKQGRLRQVRRTICPITHFSAWLITCKTMEV